MRRASVVCAALLLIQPLSSTYGRALAAQQSTSETALRGRVVDPSGGAVVGARVTITSERFGAPTSIVTGPVGEFEVPLLPGPYAVKISSTGFLEASQGITLTPASRPLEFTLQIAGVQET